MLRNLLHLCAAAAILLVAWAAVAWSDLLPRLDEADRAAIAFMQPRSPQAGGSDALPLLYRISREVPEQAWPPLAALPAAELAARVEAYPRRAVDPLLEHGDVPSLAKAMENEAALRSSLLRHAGAVDRLPDLHAAGRLSWFTATAEAPLGPDGLAFPDLRLAARLARQQAAALFLDGDAAAAARRLCASTASWRRLQAGSRALVPMMMAAREADLDARLLAELRARAPEAAAVPCATLAGDITRSDPCPALRAEFAAMEYHTGLQARRGSWVERTGFALAWHQGHARALQARALARWCAPLPPELAAALAGPLECGALEWIFDMAGCAIVPIATPAYADYAARLIDHDAALRLAALADWLRSHAGSDGPALQARFAARPAQLRGMGERLRRDGDALWLEFTARVPRAVPRGAAVPVRLPPLSAAPPV